MEYETVIGLEVHVQLYTKSKAFCWCSTEFGQPPNSQICPVCLGLPGSLPVLNKKALEYTIKVALALNCKISNFVKFDRKNYFYPDLPKNFQISQYALPISTEGYIEINVGDQIKRIGIRRIHLEEDAGKLIHEEEKNASLIDFNRSGIPLLEIVSEPDIDLPDDAYQYLINLKAILEYLEVSDCDMEKGSLRCDANISIRPKGSLELGTKTEVKNMNSFKGVRSALEYELKRQIEILNNGGEVVQETRLWDVERNVTISMRTKEEAHDYRYFPEPDLVPFVIEAKGIEEIRNSLPELPNQRRIRFTEDYKISQYDAQVLTSSKTFANWYEECVKLYMKPKLVANWLMGPILAELNVRNMGIGDLKLKPINLVSMWKIIDNGKISSKVAKEIVLPQMMDTLREPEDIVKEKSLTQISDDDKLIRIIDKVIDENPKALDDYHKGKDRVIGFLVGQVMGASEGKANPQKVSEILKKRLNQG